MNLAKKLAEIMAAVERVPKRGRNAHFGYDFATEADIAGVVRKEMADRSVVCIPAVTAVEFRDLGLNKKGEPKEPLTILHMTFEFMDGESEERIVKPWIGVGQDGGDKGAYKAMTGGEKYFILKSFLIPTGDDPEHATKAEREETREREKATVKPSAAEKKARPPVPAGVVFIEKYTPKKKGNAEWAELILSNGEEGIVHTPQLLSVAMQYAQDNTPILVTTKVNSKGNTDIEAIEKWLPAKPNGSAKELTADDIFPSAEPKKAVAEGAF